MAGFVGCFYYFIDGHRDEDSYYFERDERCWKAFRFVFIMGIICLFVRIVVPTKETCYKMLIAQNITKQTLVTTSEAFNDLLNEAVDKIIKSQNSKR